MLLINKYQIQLTTKILTNNYISLQFINNKLIILHNNSNINIQKLLTKKTPRSFAGGHVNNSLTSQAINLNKKIIVQLY